eukprot:PhM_4_TR14687/c0_g1_i1/m.16560
MLRRNVYFTRVRGCGSAATTTKGILPSTSKRSISSSASTHPNSPLLHPSMDFVQRSTSSVQNIPSEGSHHTSSTSTVVERELLLNSLQAYFSTALRKADTQTLRALKEFTQSSLNDVPPTDPSVLLQHTLHSLNSNAFPLKTTTSMMAPSQPQKEPPVPPSEADARPPAVLNCKVADLPPSTSVTLPPPHAQTVATQPQQHTVPTQQQQQQQQSEPIHPTAAVPTP